MQVLYDVFPAFVALAQKDSMQLADLHSSPPTKDTYHLTKTRVVISNDRILIAHDSNEGPVVVFSEEYDQFDKAGTKMEDSYIVTKTGKMVAFKLDRNCGCGSRLRAWNPYRHVYSSKDPSK
jgi:hypothetical protein